MVIDFHAHVFPDNLAKRAVGILASTGNVKPNTDGTVNGLLDSMSKSNVDMAVSVPVLTKPTQFDSVLDFALNIKQSIYDVDRRIVPFCGIHPNCDDIEGKIKKIYDLGFKGIKIHPEYQDTFIDDEKYIKILKQAKSYGLITLTHAGADSAFLGREYRCTPKRVKKVLDAIGGYDKFVLAHYGGHKLYNDVCDYLADENVYLDTALILRLIDEQTFKMVLDKVGSDKILFATDSPWSSATNDIKILKSFGLDKEVEDKIFYKNALKLLNL